MPYRTDAPYGHGKGLDADFCRKPLTKCVTWLYPALIRFASLMRSSMVTASLYFALEFSSSVRIASICCCAPVSPGKFSSSFLNS
jgi:hypothetical protein